MFGVEIKNNLFYFLKDLRKVYCIGYRAPAIPGISGSLFKDQEI
jgi:hypothetical protein